MASSSESSEAEDLEKFAVITDIVNSEVVKFNGSSHSPAKSKPSASLRHWREDEDIACSTSELITPEFRQHVAKKLSKFLDKNYICTGEVEHLQNGHDNSSCESSGIRLLLTSNQRLLEESSSTVSKKNKINSSSSSESDTDEEELNRLAEAAVSGYSIIQTGEGHNGSREQVEDEAVETNGMKRKKEKKKKKEKRKKTKVDEEKKEKKHKKHKKEKYKEKT